MGKPDLGQGRDAVKKLLEDNIELMEELEGWHQSSLAGLTCREEVVARLRKLDVHKVPVFRRSWLFAAVAAGCDGAPPQRQLRSTWPYRTLWLGSTTRSCQRPKLPAEYIDRGKFTLRE